MMNEVVRYGSCCECGSCVLVCPHNVIDYIDGKPKQVAKATAAHDFCGISEGIGCDVCAQVCPRLGEREHHLTDRRVRRRRPTPTAAPSASTAASSRRAARDPEVLARCEDGGVVTGAARLGAAQRRASTARWSRPSIRATPCAPVPRAVTTVDEIIASASSWYTYCPNNLALAEAEKLGLTRSPSSACRARSRRCARCSSPIRRTSTTAARRTSTSSGRRKFLKGFGERVALNIGLLCSEVFTFDGLMRDVIEGEMGIPLARDQEVQREGQGADLQARRRAASR